VAPRTRDAQLTLQNRDNRVVQEPTPTVVADRRELASAIPAALEQQGATVQLERLAGADYLLSERLVVARYSGRDLDAAIVDGRLFRQVAALRETYGAAVLLIVGPGDGRITAASRRGALAWVARQGLPVVHADGADDAAAWLLTMARQEDRRPREVLLLARRKATRPDEQLEQLVATLPGIGPVCARRLLQRFPTMAELVAADEAALRTVHGIGPERARTLAGLFRHRYGGPVAEAAAPRTAQLALAS
jgi:Fanconi anemia group M protein